MSTVSSLQIKDIGLYVRVFTAPKSLLSQRWNRGGWHRYNALDSHWEGVRFESWATHRLTSLIFFVILLTPSTQILRHYVE
jgi:hypothetical protein